MTMKNQKIVYYDDELNDEFSRANIKPKKIDAKYKYLREGLLNKIWQFFVLRIVVTPFAWLYMKIKFRHKIVNKKVLKVKTGFFIYGNHTQPFADAIVPHLLTLPKTAYLIVHPSNVSQPVVGRLTPYLGAIPLPGDVASTKNFISCINKRIAQKHGVTIYPEAHIWPYYTGIRPFKETSFNYPVKLKVPAFCFTNTYQKRKFSSRPKIVTYVDGPFYPNPSLPIKEQEKDLRNQIYNCMKERSKLSNCEYIKYIKRGE